MVKKLKWEAQDTKQYSEFISLTKDTDSTVFSQANTFNFNYQNETNEIYIACQYGNLGFAHILGPQDA
jgi:hypothetical protein